MGDTNISPPSTTGLDSEVAAISAKIMVTSMIVLFFIVGFCLFLCLYARWYWSRAGYPLSVSWRGQNASSTTVSDHRRGLDRDTLRALPVTVYDAKDFKEALECSVCLSEITQGENIRVLPKCSHGFHLECIDMWFMSHSTCPLCRNYVVNCPKTQSIESNNESQRTNGPTNLSDTNLNLTVSSDETTVFSANVVESFKEASGSSTSRQMREELVIEIPLSTMHNNSEEEMKTPVVSRLGSLKRMLSRGKRVAPSGSVDVEPV